MSPFVDRAKDMKAKLSAAEKSVNATARLLEDLSSALYRGAA